VILRHIEIQEFTCFSSFCLFTRNHHSKALEEKYTFCEGSAGLGQEVRIGDFKLNSGVSKVDLKVRHVGIRDACRLYDTIRGRHLADLASDLVPKITC